MITVQRGSAASTCVGVEARQEDIVRAAGQHAVQGDEEAVHVEDRQRVQQHVVGGEAPPRRSASALVARLPWVSIAPFGRPVVPLV